MNEQQNPPPQTGSPQQRMKELQAIPDNLKTEAQWDELIELEIAMAQGGRMLISSHKSHPHGGGQGGKGAKPQGGGGAGGQARKTGRKFHKKPAKPAAPGT